MNGEIYIIKNDVNEHVMFDFSQTKIFKNTVKEYLINKDKANTYENSVFNIKYDFSIILNDTSIF